LIRNVFLKSLGFDVSYIQQKNINQISAIPLSTSTGYGSAIECWNYRKQRMGSTI
jgi:hypothetical protein